jgi:cytosine/adenosine deaminase-related metal-dependent hydrolase
VAHHGAFHRSLGRRDFPVRVLSRYHFAHSPGLTPQLRRTYRTTDRRIPWMVHAGEGTDERCRGELDLLVDAGVLRQNTVIIHAIAFGGEDARRMSEVHACAVWCPESNRRLYGATARVRDLRAAGVRVGLGSDSPVSGVRDPLSNLAAARREGALTDAELIALATAGSSEVARLPGGGTAPGAPADLLVADTVEDLLSGDRTSVALVIVRGRPVYGERGLIGAAVEGTVAGLAVDGRSSAFDPAVGRRAVSLLRALPKAARPAWVQGLTTEDTR